MSIVKNCHCGQPSSGPPSEYPDVCDSWPICEPKIQTKTVTATIGWTISDMPHYSSFSGYREGEKQHEETVTFEVPEDYTDERVCWTLLDATNNPFITLGSPADNAQIAIRETGYRGEQAHYSLSKGDTVTISGVKRAFTGLDVEVV